MMLKMPSCWYCLREPLVRNSLRVGTNKTNNSPNGMSTSLAIPRQVVKMIPSWWGQLPFLFFLPMLLGGGAMNFWSVGGCARLFLNAYCYDYLPCYRLLHIMVQPALETEWASLSVGQVGSRSCLSLTTIGRKQRVQINLSAILKSPVQLIPCLFPRGVGKLDWFGTCIIVYWQNKDWEVWVQQ